MTAYVYMMSNRQRGIIYTGFTVDMINRGWEHRNKLMDGFTKQYNLTRLVWFEKHDSIEKAVAMEKKIKNLHRKKKIEIIERDNPQWQDLYYTVAPYEPFFEKRTAMTQDTQDPVQRLRHSQDLANAL